MTTPLPEPVPNPEASIEVRRFGNEQEAVFIVDHAVLNPEVLIDQAVHAPFGLPPPASRYPGLVARLPAAYLNQMTEVLRMPMTRIYGMPQTIQAAVYGFFGLATRAPEAMHPGQAAPHIDAHRNHSFASVHYLSRVSFGGTAFYRHKATGFERISPIRSDNFFRVRQQELTGYDSNPAAAVHDLYEEIYYVEPVFNRLIFYRAGQLHSARMDNTDALTDDPRTGRLSANLFFNTEGL